MDNRKALSAVRNKQKELKNQDRHAQETGNDTGLNVLEGRQEALELEAHLQKSRLAEEIKPFSVEDGLKLKLHHTINVLHAGKGIQSPFICKMADPPSFNKAP